MTTQRQRNLPTTTTKISSAANLPTDTPRTLLPDKRNYQYNLRNRRHNLSLTVKTYVSNFVIRQLFKGICYSHFFIIIIPIVRSCGLSTVFTE